MGKIEWEKVKRERSEWWKERERRGGRGLSGTSRSELVNLLRALEKENRYLIDRVQELEGNKDG